MFAQNPTEARSANGGSRAGGRPRRWRSLRLPDAQVEFGVSLPLGGTMVLAVLVLWLLLTPWEPDEIGAAMLVATALFLAPVHECLHLLAWPRGASRKLACRRMGWRISLRARCAGVVSRRRFLWFLSFPFLVLSVLPVLAAAIAGAGWQCLIVLTLLNALASSGDMLAALLVLAQVPRDAVVGEEGDEVVWGTAP